MKVEQPQYADGIRRGKQDKFRGLNHNEGAGDGELYRMKNLCSDWYPLLATRRKRRLYKKLTKPNGLYAWEKLCWADGTAFYYNGVKKGEVEDSRKTFAAINGYIIIAPDMKYYNIYDDVFGSLTAETTQAVVFRDGTLYGEAAVRNTIQAEGVNWADWFRVGDAISITGTAANNLSIIIREIEGDEMHFYEDSFTNETDQEATLKREVPVLNFLFENENRLWGCNDTTIYVSKLGDPFNFNVFDGLDTDSFATDTGSAGSFTGAIAFRGYPTFFKEKNVYRVYGSMPSNYEIIGSATLGLAEGSGNSLAIAGETLLYLNRNGICIYKGGLPQAISLPFGNERYKNAVAGSDGLKYYVSMEDMQGDSHFFVYDTLRGLWHEEDDTRAVHFAYAEGNLFFLNDRGEIWITGNIQDPPAPPEPEPEEETEAENDEDPEEEEQNGEGPEEEEAMEDEGPAEGEEEEDFSWEAEFTDFTEGDPDAKDVRKIHIRLELDEDAECSVWIQMDSDGEWYQPQDGSLKEEKKRSYYLAIIPRRADHYRLKLTGRGGCRVYSITREYSIGSPFKTLPGRQ